MRTPSIPGNAVIDGREMSVPATAWRLRRQEFRTVTRGAFGSARETLIASDPGLPPLAVKRSFRLNWKLVTTGRDALERAVALPGEHELILWRHETLGWWGDGVRDRFRLPNQWKHASDSAAALPPGRPAQNFAPRALVEDAELPAFLLDQATFDLASPEQGTAWFAGEHMRLGTPPAAGERIYAHVVPVYRVLLGTAQSEKVLSLPTGEAAEIMLEEI